jgi:Fe-S cluster biogenesis protein NfuA
VSSASGNAGGSSAGLTAAADASSAVTAAFRDIIAPLVRADGGHLYLLSVTRDEVHVHLTGTCAGCPGASTTRDKMMQPVLASVAPNMQIRLTTGWSVPDGAKELE